MASFHLSDEAIQLSPREAECKLKPLVRQIDVGVDCWEFRPVTLAQLRAR